MQRDRVSYLVMKRAEQSRDARDVTLTSPGVGHSRIAMSARKKGGAQCGNLAVTGRSRATICFVLLALPESLSAFSGVSSTSTFHDWVPPSYRSNAHCTDRNGISSLWAKKKEESERNDDKNDIDGDEDYDDTEPTRDDNNLLDRLNPFNAGKSFRSTVGSALDFIQYGVPGSVSRLPPERRSIYLDDQLGLGDPYFDQSGVTSQDEDYRPEVLVVGASGELGRTLVKRLLVEGRVRVRVFVRDLFSSTLNKLGTGVTYCQGDLKDIESLEYAVTDVDKIVFCASGKRTVDSEESERAEQARAIDSDGLRNLIHAYCNVRFADYGNSQAAKRLLFKFKRKSDIDLFAIDGGSLDAGDSTNAAEDRQQIAQFDWRQNKFGKGIFTGKVERLGEASISSVRLRARDSADKGIDLRSGGYAGFVCRCCSDGAIYECFIRTEAFQRLGIEYVCEFRTAQKPIGDKDSNSSRLKWTTVRLEFIDFRPRMRQFDTSSDGDRSRMKQALAKNDIPRFDGSDIRQIGLWFLCVQLCISFQPSSPLKSRISLPLEEQRLERLLSFFRLHQSVQRDRGARVCLPFRR